MDSYYVIDYKLSLEVIMNESNTAKRLKKSESLPKYGSVRRQKLFNIICDSPKYKKKGRPFFSENELLKFEQKYKIGISWNEINRELEKKGIDVYVVKTKEAVEFYNKKKGIAALHLTC